MAKYKTTKATPQQVAVVRQMWGTAGRVAIADAAGISIDQLANIVAIEGLPSMRGKRFDRSGDQPRQRSQPDPSAAEIAARAAEVRKSWGPAEYALRQGITDLPSFIRPPEALPVDPEGGWCLREI